MSESAMDLVQRSIAALWDAARTLGTDKVAVKRLAGLVESIGEFEAQLAGLRLHLLHEARLSAADRVVEGVRQSVRTTPAQATAALRLAEDLGERFPLIAAALSHGVVSLPQADAIVSGLRKLPARLTRAELVECQELILAHVDTLGPSELRILASRLTEVVDPDRADADDATRLAREERAAHRDRFLHLSPDHHGSMRITGQLPVADAALLTAQLDALMPPASKYTNTGEHPSRGARRADALVLLTQHAASNGTLPKRGVDRPQVHITLDYGTLVTGLGQVTVLGGAGVDGLSASEARRLACDADLIPMVLGTASRPLDVGRTHRLFTPALRAAIVQRDQGCVFPGCTTPPAPCQAHHIIPWWAGGDTCLANGVLLCPHHHRLVEPDPLQSEESQWQVHIDDETGLPWFTPPRHIDPARRPRLHQRHRLQQLDLQSGAPPCPQDAAEPPDPPEWDVDPPDPDTCAMPDHHGPALDELIRRNAAWGADAA
ncbi:HNH endonuclease signature motif containing protein [Tessaracoccus sp. G1721]